MSVRQRIGHRLNRDRGIAPDRNRPNLDTPRFSANNLSICAIHALHPYKKPPPVAVQKGPTRHTRKGRSRVQEQAEENKTATAPKASLSRQSAYPAVFMESFKV